MRTIRSVPLLLVVGLFVAACAGSSAALSPVGNEVPQDNGGVASGPQPGPTSAPRPVTGGDGQVALVDDAKIIRTGTMALEVADVTTALRTARDAIIGIGGYVGASTTSNQSDRPTAEITYRIPVTRWEDALDALRGSGGPSTKVVTEHTEAVEVTSQVVDLGARIANLRASETALQAIAAQATKISDILEVQARLTETRGQIETLTAQLKSLTDRASYATLTVSYNTPVVAVQLASSGWQPGAEVDSAAAALLSVAQGLASAGIWIVIVWVPILLVLGIFAVVGIRIARRFGISWRAIRDPQAPVLGDEG